MCVHHYGVPDQLETSIKFKVVPLLLVVIIS